MTHWIGRWLMGVAILHSAIAIAVYHKTVVSVWQAGVFNTVVGDPVIGAVVWSLLFGCVAFIGGLALSALESASIPVPKTVGSCSLALAIIGVVLVPVSGFWLLLPVAFTVLTRKTIYPAPASLPS
jgi:Family of unknown function (DUF6463)